MTARRTIEALALVEATTLVVLLVAAVLRHAFGNATLVHVMGPVHGVVYVLYLLTVLQSAAEERIPRALAIRLLLLGFVPFGGIFAAIQTARLPARS